MDDLIQRLDSWLRQNRPEFYQQLLPGLSDEELANFEKTLGVELPDDFKLLYQWKNGEQDDYISFIHNLGWGMANRDKSIRQRLTSLSARRNSKYE